MHASPRLLAPLLALVVAMMGCPNPSPTGRWSIVGQRLPEAMLSITGRSASDVWTVGADKGQGPAVLHYDGASWTRLATGQRGHLWWVHAFSDGTAMMGGAGGMILRYDGTTFTRMETPGLGRHTVFGIWGSSPSDVYAVGGASNRGGFIWHYDGTTWSDVPLPRHIPMLTFDVTGEDDPTDVPGLFKVWGDGAGTVWVVGGANTILRSTMSGPFEVVSAGLATASTLFTVSGNANLVVTVGGGSNGLLLEGTAGTFADRSPPLSGLIQGISVQADGTAWASGQRASMFQRTNNAWVEVDTGLAFETMIQSLHATWVDPTGGVWAVGGSVLSTDLDNGAVIHFGGDVAPLTGASLSDAGPLDAGPPPGDAGPVAPRCPEMAVDPLPTGSIARRWNEQMLNAIRRDIPKPGVHARNLFHVSASMWDAWAAYDTTADGVFYTTRETATDIAAARQEAISFAAYRTLMHRYAPALSTGGPISQDCFTRFMGTLGYDPMNTGATGNSPAAIGNRIAMLILSGTMNDGANEAMNYADTTSYMPTNPPLVLDIPGSTVPFPGIWQQLNLSEAVTQNGIVLPGGIQPYIGPQWSAVRPFALEQTGGELLADLGVQYPQFEHRTMPGQVDPEMRDWLIEVLRRESELEVNAMTIDISPGRYGNNTLGMNVQRGYPMNPATSAPYAANVVPLGDFGRVLAEFWADGPRSETPPGHWNTIANYVADQPTHRRCLGGSADFATCTAGTTPEMDALEWDVKIYLALNGAVHDAAVVAWGIKRMHLCSRPLTMIRHMAARGQSSEMSMPSYHPEGLPLIPGLIELITAETTAAGARHEHLAPFVGEIAVRGWRGEPGNRDTQIGGVTWILGRDWIPYQRRNFVTPAFPSFTSGHSTFSRAAAEVLTDLNGSPYFPAGLGEFTARRNTYLTFEEGPSVDITLQWATYFDAADQAGQSRIWGGIHISADDLVGRRTGRQTGLWAVARARRFFDGTENP